MFTQHVKRTFKAQWLKFLMLGLLIVLSSFIYGLMGLTARGLDQSAKPFFDETNQEDVRIDFNPYVTEEELLLLSDVCSAIDTVFLDTLSRTDRACFEAIVEGRIAALNTRFDTVTFEARHIKDATLKQNDTTHRIRFLKDNKTINLSYITDGEKPQNANEIAILKNYAKHHDLAIGDTVEVLSETYIITGFVLFPDYNLPVLDHPFLFDSTHQTLGLLTDDAFDQINAHEPFSASGVFDTDIPEDFRESLMTLPFYQSHTLTENNLRSGAIYAEIAAGQGSSIFFSVLIAAIGITIVSIMLVKTLEQARGSIGVFKALGLSTKEMIWPFVLFIALFAFTFLTIGFVLGYLLSPMMINLFLIFYLLPEASPGLTWLDPLFAIALPLVVVVGLSLYQLNKLIGLPVVSLIQPSIKTPKKTRFKRIRQLFDAFSIYTRVQIGLLIRQWSKALIYVIGLFLAIFLIFMSLAMRNIFTMTTTNYYKSTTIESIAYCNPLEPCPVAGHEKVIEMPGTVNVDQAFVIALGEIPINHPLTNRRGESLYSALDEGLVLSQSFSDLSGLRVDDTATLIIGDQTLDVVVTGISYSYPGNYVFTSRHFLGEQVFDDAEYYNVIYADEPLSEADYPLVIHIEDILEQAAYTSNIFDSMFTAFIAVSVGMAAVIIYLLTMLSIEEQYYEISLLKVLGYEPKEIGKMLLGGYFKLNVITFILTIPFAWISFRMLRQLMAEMFAFIMPMQLSLWHIPVTALMVSIIYVVASSRAKQKVKTRALQEALKIYQV